MSETQNDEIWAVDRFDIDTLEDEIRVEEACRQLLRLFYLDQIKEGRAAEEAGALAHGADYFLCDFIIADRRENIFRLPPGRVRQFAGNWYIIKTLEPNPTELGTILAGIAAFYDFGRRSKRIPAEIAETVRAECADFDYYCRRIEEFWAIGDDGFLKWNRECPL